MTSQTSPAQEDVLLAFSCENDASPATLAEYVRRYPGYAGALADLAVELMIVPLREDACCSPQDATVDRAWETFRSSATSLETKSLGAAGSLIAALPPAEFRALAKRIGVNTLFLVQLRDRIIDATTIPRRFVELLARELSSTVSAVMDDLARPPMVAASERFKSDQKPGADKRIAFADAIGNSDLDDEQQQKLRAFMD
ncbi:hypothetical protein [Hyphomicrobium facile]|uniref:Uncharacterized protein n=1 Tax=Hyphomicrobium facile TaxID=51670 RepID=A0A1I7N4D8_9HYPH|nr:hypothetical protein [Hyphomicrobium facile]SFV29453.1 hypothetical protein SAMN04488557_1255 [Hyphomicrobium facile]